MRMLRAVYHLVRADYLERVRRSSFLIVLALTVFAGYASLPAATAGYSTLSFGSENAAIWYRGLYNSAWVATQVSLWATVWLTLAGFFLVRDTVGRDIQTGVGQIIATTPLSKLSYIIGKTLSNLAVLSSMVVVLIVATVLIQLLRGESVTLDAWQLISPFVFMLLPALAVVSALAVLFECIKFLRGSIGSVIYVIFYFTMVTLSFIGMAPLFDMLGVSYSVQNMQKAFHVAFPHLDSSLNVSIAPTTLPPHTFIWLGNSWSWNVISERLFWLALAGLIVLITPLFFTRFDTMRMGQKRLSRRSQSFVKEPSVEEPSGAEVSAISIPSHLTPLPAQSRTGLASWGAVLLGELRLSSRDVPWWWYVGVLLWIVLCLFLPFEIARAFILPIAWIWPLPIWSSLGNREKRDHMQQLVFSTPRILLRQFPVLYLGAVAVTLFVASGMLLRYLLVGDTSALIALLLGSFFIPALALAAGVWTSNKRLFELLYVILWYIGSINQMPFLDFMGITKVSLASGVPYAFGIVTLFLLVLAVAGRRIQFYQ